MKEAPRSGVWTAQKARSCFAALVRTAIASGPQTILSSGRPIAVVLSAADYDRLRRPRPSFAEFLARSPLVGAGLKLERDRRSAPGFGDRGDLFR
ncbi:MAG: type II toxin-antitoxin system prevent-host-death family antitoxin [Acidobacteria bacterium]|nr:type II toxin-antitoxin system prevent-host-death family antitoxin [Acidobacteriota bacterium]MYA46292.1 type II toxin-antitoxin system prevent-host-death family antitoxin [Acidobacteriota bacterium]MYI37720.1 type II toxin-antitoxin system prevent-host-death family antitoxin [Acidobacteriota bacterium]